MRGGHALFQRLTVLFPWGGLALLGFAFNWFWTPVGRPAVEENAHIVDLQQVRQGNCVVGASSAGQRSESDHGSLVVIERS